MQPGLTVHIFNPSTREADRRVSGFKVILVYLVNSMTARRIQRPRKTTTKEASGRGR